jgi:hypothetical protein
MRRAAAFRMAVSSVGLCLLVALGTARVRSQGKPDIAVVVQSEVHADDLSMADLRRVLLGDREFWPGGVRVTLLIRAPVSRERDTAVRDVCQMTEAQFRQHWIGKVFRAETGSGPKIAYSREGALDQASRMPGAITLVEVPVTTKGVKVLKIDGKSPGQVGYPLH